MSAKLSYRHRSFTTDTTPTELDHLYKHSVSRGATEIDLVGLCNQRTRKLHAGTYKLSNDDNASKLMATSLYELWGWANICAAMGLPHTSLENAIYTVGGNLDYDEAKTERVIKSCEHKQTTALPAIAKYAGLDSCRDAVYMAYCTKNPKDDAVATIAAQDSSTLKILLTTPATRLIARFKVLEGDAREHIQQFLYYVGHESDPLKSTDDWLSVYAGCEPGTLEGDLIYACRSIVNSFRAAGGDVWHKMANLNGETFRTYLRQYEFKPSNNV